MLEFGKVLSNFDPLQVPIKEEAIMRIVILLAFIYKEVTTKNDFITITTKITFVHKYMNHVPN